MAPRTDWESAAAPQPNRWAPAVSCVVWFQGHIVLQLRRDTGQWGLPGGAMEFGESIQDTAAREVAEETGLRVATPVRLVGVYANPRHVIAYSDGEVRQEFAVVVECEADGTLHSDTQESLAVRTVTPDQLPAVPMDPRHRQRLFDALQHGPAVVR